MTQIEIVVTLKGAPELRGLTLVQRATIPLTAYEHLHDFGKDVVIEHPVETMIDNIIRELKRRRNEPLVEQPK